MKSSPGNQSLILSWPSVTGIGITNDHEEAL